jgi:hypothetical protein
VCILKLKMQRQAGLENQKIEIFGVRRGFISTGASFPDLSTSSSSSSIILRRFGAGGRKPDDPASPCGSTDVVRDLLTPKNEVILAWGFDDMVTRSVSVAGKGATGSGFIPRVRHPCRLGNDPEILGSEEVHSISGPFAWPLSIQFHLFQFKYS